MTRSRRSVELRRDEILASTTETVDRIGLEATRVTDVAKALNVSSALIFYHFGTKDALDRRGVRVRRRARPGSGSTRPPAPSTDPVDTPAPGAGVPTVPTGAAKGWRIWIDAWALAQRRSRGSGRCSGGWSSAGARCCAPIIDDGRRRRIVHLCRPGSATVARVSVAHRRVCRWRRWSTARSPGRELRRYGWPRRSARGARHRRQAAALSRPIARTPPPRAVSQERD